jgi:hypothetical protein
MLIIIKTRINVRKKLIFEPYLRSGKLVHIDFGYILGRDPKPLPPPMKLSKEMIEGFGGVNSEHYQAGLEKTWVFKKKPAQWVFLFFFWVFWVFCFFWGFLGFLGFFL